MVDAVYSEEEMEEEEMEMGGWYGGENLFGGTEF